MFRALLVSIVAACFVPTASLATPPVRLPETVVESPQPPKPVDGVTKLSSDRLYVIDSDVPLIVLSSPSGMLSTTTEAGPLKIRGMFVDGGGKRETRTFSGKFVVTVEGLSAGRCELFVIPQGITNEASVIRRRLEIVVDVPGPAPDPKPDPNPDVQPVTPAKLWVVIIEETSEAASNRGAMLSDAKLIDRMNTKQHRFRVVDKDVVGTDGRPPADIARFLTASKGKSLPQLFLVDEKGHPRFSGDMPKSAADLLALITKVGG